MSEADRPPLSRQRIAQTALTMISEFGYSKLSMRKLGAELGVEAMSLYHYVANKDDLLDAVLDELYDAIELPEQLADPEWESALRIALRSFNKVLNDHPSSLELFVSRPGRSLAAFRVLRWSLHQFQRAGLDVVQSVEAFHFCVSYIVGHAATEAGSLRQLRVGVSIDTSVVDDEDFAEFVSLNEQLPPDTMLEHGLDTLVAGLRASYGLA